MIHSHLIRHHKNHFTFYRSPAESHFDEASPIYTTDHVSDIETTPAHKLPGNIRYESEESDIQNTPRGKNRFRKSGDYSDNLESSGVLLDAEVINLLAENPYHKNGVENANLCFHHILFLYDMFHYTVVSLNVLDIEENIVW